MCLRSCSFCDRVRVHVSTRECVRDVFLNVVVFMLVFLDVYVNMFVNVVVFMLVFVNVFVNVQRRWSMQRLIATCESKYPAERIGNSPEKRS